MPRQTDLFERGRIIGMLEAGSSVHEVARRIGRDRRTITMWWRRYQQTADCNRQPGSGRPRLTSARTDRYLRMLICQNRFMSGTELRSAWATVTVVRPSIRTTYRRCLALGYRSRRPVIRIPLGPNHIQARLNWAAEHETWRMRQWRNVMFSDESRFCLDFHDGRVRVRRLPSERFLDDCIVEHDRYGGGSVMVWAGIMSNRRTDLVPVQGTLTGQRYVEEILIPHVLPAAQQFGRQFVFQHDNARPHICRVPTEALGDVTTLEWPARSPDMSPIEHLWDELGRRLRDEYDNPPATLLQLQQRLLEQWQRIDIVTIRQLFLGMPRRVSELLRRRGRHTRY